MTASMREAIFVGAKALAAELDAATGRPVLLDVRNRNGVADGRPEYLQGHLPGAVYVHLPTELQGASHPGSGAGPLPDVEDLQRAARRWGIGRGDRVVVYDNVSGTKAGRAWFDLRWAGIDDVRLLDGGYAAWVAEGLPVTTKVPDPDPGDVELSPDHLGTLDADEAQALAAQGLLFDARGRSQFRGDRSGDKPTGGHIPGAHAAPTTENLDDRGLLLDEESLRSHFARLGIDGSRTIGLYCGSGVAASHELAVLAGLGIAARLYVGSFSAWSADPDRPVEFGE